MTRNIDTVTVRASSIAVLASLEIHYKVYEAIVYTNNMDFLNGLFNGRAFTFRPYFLNKKTGTRNPIASNFVDRLMAQYNIDLVPGSNLSQIIKYLDKTLITHLMVNINQHCQMYVNRYLRMFFARHDRNMNIAPTKEEKNERTRSITNTIRYIIFFLYFVIFFFSLYHIFSFIFLDICSIQTVRAKQVKNY